MSESITSRAQKVIEEISQAFPDTGMAPISADAKVIEQEFGPLLGESLSKYSVAWRLLPRSAMVEPDGVIHHLSEDKILYYLPAFMTEEVREDNQRLGMALCYILLGKDEGAYARRIRLANAMNGPQIKATKSFLHYYSKFEWIEKSEADSWPNC
jgi:hypothetical protein